MLKTKTTLPCEGAFSNCDLLPGLPNHPGIHPPKGVIETSGTEA
jgi:hypothetical protein